MSGARGTGFGAHQRYVSGTSRLHCAPPECKVAATVLFVVAVVSAPREAFWAYGCFAGLLTGLVVVSGVPFRLIGRRLAIDVPFVAFAVLLPFVGRGERVEVLGASLSVAGLWAAWNILVKGTLGVAATTLLATTTSVPELLCGLDRLRVPRAFTAIAGFMVRYAEVITGEVRRMRIARLSRGYDARWVWQGRAVAASAGTLFIRAFERGERIHVAMLSRGFTGELPRAAHDQATRRDWALASLVPVLAAAAAVAAQVAA